MRFLVRRVLASIRLLGALAAVAALFWSTPAAAQSVALTGIITATPPYQDRHPDAVPVGIINHADCVADESINIPLSLSGNFTGTTGLSLEAWVGEATADCTATDARGATTATCWPLAQGISPAQITSVNIKVRDIVHQLGTAIPKKIDSSSSIGAGTLADCDSAFVTSGPHPVRISFFFSNLTTAQGTGATWDATVALTAQALSGDISAQGADTLIKVGLPSGQGTSLKGFDIYCDDLSESSDASATDSSTSSDATVAAQCPVPDSSVPVVDAGDDADASDASGAADASDASADSSVNASVPDCGSIPTTPGPNSNGVSANGCYSSVLGTGTVAVDGGDAGSSKQTTGLDAYHCAHVDNTSTNATITSFRGAPLINGHTYAVAAAATDQYGNVGPLTPPQCATPAPVDDFWNVYTNAGGKAGGNFCALDAAGMPAGVAVFGGVMAMAAMALVRRRRRS